MPLIIEVGLSLRDFVLDGDRSPSAKRERSPQIFDPYLLWPNGCMDQDGTWHRGRPHPGDFVLDGDPAPSPERGRSPSSQFSDHFYSGQMARYIKMPLGMEVGPIPGDFVFDGDQDPLPKKGTEPQIFGPCLFRPNGCIDQDATWYGGIRPRPRRLCVK